MNDQTLPFDPAELTTCDREPIDTPGAVQPHGALLAINPRDFSIVHAGGDTAGLLGAPPESLPGSPAARILSGDQIERLRGLLASGRPIGRPLHAFSMPARPAGSAAEAVAHQSGGLVILEFDPEREQAPDNSLALVQTMVRRVQQAETTQAFCDAVAAEVRAATGFDRVLVYRFMRDGSGAVIAEAIGEGVESFLGLRFPESDIPKQARALYLKNWIRTIPDARYAPAPIFPPARLGDGRPLDLSQSVLRSVSAVHRQYLANLGAAASMSLSIILHGRLWGLIACHHRAPRYLPYRLREACELFAEMASSQLEMKVAAEDYEARLRSTRIHEELLARMSQEPDLADGLLRSRPDLFDYIPADGVALWVDGRFTGRGATPSAEQIAALVAWLNAAATDGVFYTDSLALLYQPAERYADVASGLLALSISKIPRDYILWFRPEVVRTVTWAGNPNKKAESGPDGGFLTPRRSFAAWQESVRRHSAPWLAFEVEAAHRLRLSILEVVLRRIDQVAREREAARHRQEQLSKELDHRLEQWRSVAQALKRETERRAVVEAELSEVLRRTVTDQEAERLRIARELHDTLGQSLTLLQLGLDGIGQASSGSSEVQTRLAAMKNLAADVGREVNRLAWEIRPTALDDLGIEIAVRNLLDTWSERSKLQFDLHLSLDDRRLPAAIETALYRVLQEALTNVVRHAEATRVDVILRRADQTVTMIVEDDGRGFGWHDDEPANPPVRRLGLLGIRERLSLVGGSLEVESNPGKGTTLFIRIPIRE